MLSMSLKKFFFCLPARFGALLLTAVSFGAGCILIGFDWADIASFANRPSLSHLEMGSLISSALILTFVTLVSLIGFFAAWKRDLRILVPYNYAIIALTLISIIIGSFYLAILFGSDAAQRDVYDCVNGKTGGGGMTPSMCNYLYKTGRAVMAVTLVIYWLILLYNAFISWILTAELKQNMRTTGKVYQPSPSPAMSIFGVMPPNSEDDLDEKLRPRMPGALDEQPHMHRLPQLPMLPQVQPPQPPALAKLAAPQAEQPVPVKPIQAKPAQDAAVQQSQVKPDNDASEEPDWLYAPIPPPPKIGAPPSPEVRKMRRKREMSPSGRMRSGSSSTSSSRSTSPRVSSRSTSRDASPDSIRTLVGSVVKVDERPMIQINPVAMDPFANPFPAPKMGSSDNV